MGERYTRLYDLPQNLYLEGAPVLVAAGALLKDEREGKVLAQLKLQNLQASPLIACKVCVKAFEPSGEEVEGVQNFPYLDIHVERGAFFGTQTAIYLPDATARKITVAVTQAVLENGEVWQQSEQSWQPVFAPLRTLAEQFPDDELQRQYRLENVGECRYVPAQADGLLLCTCGTVNLADCKVCSHCQREILPMIAALDLPTLTTKRDARLQQEAAERAERERIQAEEQARRAEEQARREEEQRKAREREEAERKAAALKRKKKNIIISGVAAFVVVFFFVITKVIILPNRYKTAENLLAAGNYDDAAQAFLDLGNYSDAAERALQTRYTQAEAYLQKGQFHQAAAAFSKAGDYKNAKERALQIWENFEKCISAGSEHTVGLKANGTVVATGDNEDGACDVGRWTGWTDIVAVSAGSGYTVGLKANGTVVVTGGYNRVVRCDVDGWTDIVAVSVDGHTVGLKADGTVVATGFNMDGECEVGGWTDIVAVSAGYSHTVGLKADGTVVATGSNRNGACDVGGWTDIVAVSASGRHTVGLKADGTVVATGDNEDGACDVDGWTDIVAVSAGDRHTVGLKADGTVVATGYRGSGRCEVYDWTNIKPRV